jgi:hypothetical protein
MNTNIRKSRTLKKYLSAVRNVVNEELGQLGGIREQVEQTLNLSWDIKEMLEDALVGAYLAPPTKDLISAVFHERFPFADEKQRALDALNVALDHAKELRALLTGASPIIRELLIAHLRAATLAANSPQQDGTNGKQVVEPSGEA